MQQKGEELAVVLPELNQTQRQQQQEDLILRCTDYKVGVNDFQTKAHACKQFNLAF